MGNGVFYHWQKVLQNRKGGCNGIAREKVLTKILKRGGNVILSNDEIQLISILYIIFFTFSAPHHQIFTFY